MPQPLIPFNRPHLARGSLRNVGRAFAQRHISGGGPYGRQCESWLERRLGAPRILLTTSCTHALEMTALLLGLGPGDEVVLPTFTFVSTAGAYALRGAKPVFVDIRPDTLNLDERKIAAALTPRTRAIVVVHYAGVACEMDPILELARDRGIPVIEDNAHGLFGRYRGRPLGTLGTFATLSFHETKNISCGEGGALAVNNRSRIAAAEIVREKGTDRSRFLRGQVDKYTWRALGSSYAISDALAALLHAQLEDSKAIQERRARIWNRYDRELRQWASAQGARQPHVPVHCRQSHHMYYLVAPGGDARDRFIRHLKARRINAVFHYLPLHLSPMGRAAGGRRGQCPVAESASRSLVRLPFYTGMTVDEQARVIAAVQAFET